MKGVNILDKTLLDTVFKVPQAFGELTNVLRGDARHTILDNNVPEIRYK